MLKKLTLFLIVTTIVALNAILLIGAGTGGQVVGTNVYFGLLVEAMYAGLISSSLLLGYLS